MNRFLVMLKLNLKLLLRNKAFIFFLCFTPILSASILCIKMESKSVLEKQSIDNILELDGYQDKAVYVGDNTSFIIKVYDGSESQLSEYLLNKLTRQGVFSVCRCKVSMCEESEIEAQTKVDAFEDRAGALLYLKEDFDECVKKGDYINALQVYDISDDERWELFESGLTNELARIYKLSQMTGGDTDKILSTINQIEENLPNREQVNIQDPDKIVLTDEQANNRSLLGYALSIITLGFLFCGVIVAHTVIEEQNNKVYTRAMLSKLNRTEYFLAKMTIALIIATVQTLILGLCIFVVGNKDFGIDILSFMCITLCIGFIFSILSLLLGIIIGDVMSSNYAVFAFWSISALLSGLYFPLDDTSETLQAISNLMPQRWFMVISEKLLVGDKSAYPMLLYITAAYLIIFTSVGCIGLKMKRNDA